MHDLLLGLPFTKQKINQTNGSSCEIGKGRDDLVEAGCLDPLDINLWLRKIQQLHDYTMHWQIHWWSAEEKCAWFWDHRDRRIKRLPVSTRAKGGINALVHLIAQRHQEHATLQQSISEVPRRNWMPHSQKTTEEGITPFSAYIFMELFLHARMLGVSAALLTFTSQGISVLQSWWHLTNFTARIRKKMHKCTWQCS